MTDLYSRRRRARKLANGELEKSEDEDDAVNPWDLDLDDLDHAGVVQKVADDLDDDRAEELVKSLRGDDDVAKAIQRHNIFAGDRDDLDLEPLDYSDLDKSTAEREREQLARDLADELERRGITAAGDDEDGDDGVQKDAADDLSTEVEEWADEVQKFVEDRRGAA